MIEYLKDKYNIIAKVDEGGLGSIYKAISLDTKKVTAIKILKTQKNSHKNKKRFLSEIKAIRNIKSPYVVEAYDYDWNDKVQYLAMEFVEGKTIKKTIQKRGRLTVDEVVDYAKQMALGLHEIHKSGIIHRDIKSTNIMLTDHGKIKIIDLGIALHDESERVTATGNVIGSVHYIAPEIISPSMFNNAKTDFRVDIYAMGILMYEMLIGDLPFKAATAPQTAYMHTTSRVPHINKIYSNIPQALANVVIKATAREPHFRYASAYKLYEDLSSCLSTKRINEKVVNLDKKEKVSLMSAINSKWTTTIIVGVIIACLVAVIIALVLV